MPDPFKLLEDLLAAPSPSGYEKAAQLVFGAACREFASDITTDVMGNTYASINPSGQPKVILAGHIDEIGFLVTYIHADGFLYFDPIGGHDANITLGQRVLVHTTENGAIPGVVGRKPIHSQTDEERSRKIQLAELFIDIGAASSAAAQEFVQIGDPITYSSGFERLGAEYAVAHGFDNKIGAFVIAEALRLATADGGLRAAVTAVATVQEELGQRGARTAAHHVDADVGIAVDVGHATDYPGTDKRHLGDVRCGGGPILTRGANINPEVYKRLTGAAKSAGVAVQIVARPGGTRTDANVLQINRDGMAVGLISVPVRYMHTPCELASLADISGAAQLLARFLLDLAPDDDLRPVQ